MTDPIKNSADPPNGLAYPVQLTNGRTAMLWTGFVILLLTVVILSAPVYQILSANLHKNQFDRAKFNRIIWAMDKTSASGGSRRASMAENVLKLVLKPGMTKVEVIEILGEPEYVDQRAETQKGTIETKSGDAQSKGRSHHAGYYLGEEIGGDYGGRKDVDKAWLDLRFDASDHYLDGIVYLPPTE